MTDRTTSTLSAHSGAKLVSLQDLIALPTPAKLGRFHQPVRHAEFVTALKEVMGNRGYLVKREQYALQTGGAKLFGALDFEGGDGERGVAMGFRKSNDKSFGMNMVAGSRVFVCDNMCLSGEEVVLKRKQTSGFSLYDELNDAAGRFIAAYAKLDLAIAALKQATLSATAAKEIIYDAFVNEEVLAMRYLPSVDGWYFGSGEAHEDAPDCAPRTAWGLHNAFTRTIKEVGGLNNQQRAGIAVGHYLEAAIK